MKKIDTSTIVIEKLIVHSIPKRKKEDFSVEPQFSENETELSTTLKLFFKDKVIQSLLSNKELRVCYSPENISPVSTYIKSIIESNGSNLIEQSKLITQYLFDVQNGQNASGIVLIFFGKISEENICVILKLERDKGAQLQLDTVTKTFNIREIQDLMLTERTRIYKVGLFFDKSKFNVDYDGSTADLQIDPKTKKEITTWFIERFLGCIPLEDPRATTKKFYEYTTTFIQAIESPIKKAKYTQDLNSYLQKNSANISALEFANDYMETIDKDSYNSYLREKKFRTSAFPKDNSYIDKKIKVITMTFDNNILIIGKKGTFEKNVRLESQDNGLTKAEIVSKVKSIK